MFALCLYHVCMYYVCILFVLCLYYVFFVLCLYYVCGRLNSFRIGLYGFCTNLLECVWMLCEMMWIRTDFVRIYVHFMVCLC